jgi:hypothetical protein
MKFEKEIARVLQARLTTSNMINVVDALGYTEDHFQQAFEVALEMDNQNLAKLLYSSFNARKIVIEFTLLAYDMPQGGSEGIS